MNLKVNVSQLLQGLGSVRAIDAIGAGTAVLMSVLVFTMGIQPIVEHQRHLHAQREALTLEQQRADSASRTAQQLHAHLQATRRAVERNPMHLASLRALNERLAQMTELATDKGLRIERIQPGRQVPGDHYHTVPIKLVGHGEFGASTRFLHELHQSFPDVAIASLSLTGRPDRLVPGEPPSFDLTLLWYAAPPLDAERERS